MTDETASDAPLVGTAIGRVALRVADRDVVAAFYTDVVGLRQLADAGVDAGATDDGFAATDPDGIELRVAVA